MRAAVARAILRASVPFSSSTAVRCRVAAKAAQIVARDLRTSSVPPPHDVGGGGPAHAAVLPPPSATAIDEYDRIMRQPFDETAVEGGIAAAPWAAAAVSASSSVYRLGGLVEYECDCDEYLHMSLSHAQGMDQEHLSGLDMLGHDDVADIREQRRELNSPNRDSEGEEKGSEVVTEGVGFIDEALLVKESVFEEFEEDWEILHAKMGRYRRNLHPDDGDTVIDW